VREGDAAPAAQRRRIVPLGLKFEEGQKPRTPAPVEQTPPISYFDTDEYSEDLELKVSAGKGVCVHTKKKKGINTRLPYGGIVINKQEKDKRIAESKSGKSCGDVASYIAEIGRDCFEDAHYSFGAHLQNKYGGRVNEPSKNEQANMLLCTEPWNGKLRVVYITTREILAGEELTAFYGDEYNRTYEVGKQADVPEWL